MCYIESSNLCRIKVSSSILICRSTSFLWKPVAPVTPMFLRVKLVTGSDHSGSSLFYQIVRCAQHRDLQKITFTVNVLEDEEKDENNEI